ncbi:MAG: carboxymuconolactone decarboxylase family protein [Planctomycetaceae bacterium]|nr:carboxymuconolactone decarboxylase family protein [Planctomycetaceae bacterium]
MSARIQPLEVNQAEGRTQELFQGIKAKFGKVPNMMRTMGHAPALLDGYLNLNATLSRGVLPPQVREQVNLAVSQANSCEYCVSAHTLLGKHAGLSAEQMLDARRGRSADAKVDVLLKLAVALGDHRGNVPDDVLGAAHDAGWTDAELTELVGHVSLITLTNFFNQLAHTEVDFPRVVLELPEGQAA